jgi:hypothetical protein
MRLAADGGNIELAQPAQNDAKRRERKELVANYDMKENESNDKFLVLGALRAEHERQRHSRDLATAARRALMRTGLAMERL